MIKTTWYEAKHIDAWAEGESLWCYNQTFRMFDFPVREGSDVARAFRRALNKRGIKLSSCYATDCPYGDWTVEVRERKSGRPVFCAEPVEDR